MSVMSDPNATKSGEFVNCTQLLPTMAMFCDVIETPTNCTIVRVWKKQIQCPLCPIQTKSDEFLNCTQLLPTMAMLCDVIEKPTNCTIVRVWKENKFETSKLSVRLPLIADFI